MKKKKKETLFDPVGSMPEADKGMDMVPPKGAKGMEYEPTGEMVQVKKHMRRKAETTQGHPHKRRQPSIMRYFD